MQKPSVLAVLLTICLLPPIIAFYAFSKGYHGLGYTNKGHLITPMLVDKSMDKYLEHGKFVLFSVKKPQSQQKLEQFYKALGFRKYRVATAMISFVPKSLTKLYQSGYVYYIADPSAHIILGYKEPNWQENTFKDLKHLLKVSS